MSNQRLSTRQYSIFYYYCQVFFLRNYLCLVDLIKIKKYLYSL